MKTQNKVDFFTLTQKEQDYFLESIRHNQHTLVQLLKQFNETEEFIKKAVGQDGSALQYVNKDLMTKLLSNPNIFYI
jgi:hypothetical protein